MAPFEAFRITRTLPTSRVDRTGSNCATNAGRAWAVPAMAALFSLARRLRQTAVTPPIRDAAARLACSTALSGPPHLTLVSAKVTRGLIIGRPATTGPRAAISELSTKPRLSSQSKTPRHIFGPRDANARAAKNVFVRSVIKCQRKIGAIEGAAII